MRFNQLILSVCLLGLLATGCALRPRYGDFVTAKTEGKELALVVIDTATTRPVPGAKVELSELKNRLNLTTASDGTFKVPVEKKYLDENSIFVVTLPKDVTGYRIELARASPPPPPPTPNTDTPPANPTAPAAPEAVDAGTPAN
ncbi:MAG: hypothetical protein JNM17_19605 [Archangium sp.]|nr:hypothetical protein [Archangium sp.]